MTIKHLILALVLCLTSLPINANAQIAPPRNLSITNDGAIHLKAIFDSLLRDQVKIQNVRDDAKLEQQGDVIVEAARDFYAITLPHLQMKYADGSRLELGIISINAAPHSDAETQWKMTLALPTPIVMYDAQNNQTMRISIEGQQAAGIFHENLQLFSKLDATYQNITIEGASPAYKANIPRAVLRFDMNAAPDGRWSGPGYLELQDITINQNDAVKLADIKSIKAAFSFDRFDPTAALTYRKRFTNLIDQDAFKSGKLSPDHQQRLSSAIYDLFTKGMNGLTSSYTLKGVTLTQPPQSLDAPPETFHIDDGAIALKIGGFLDNSAFINLSHSYSGFDTTTISAQDKDIIPANANLDIAIKNIPFNQLIQIAQNTIASGGTSSKESMQIAGLGLLLKVPALLSGAGTTIEIKDNSLGNDTYKIALDGDITADITATNSATAKAKGTFKGLDALIGKLKAMQPNLSGEKAEKTSQLTETLQWIKSLGKKPLGLNPTYSYDFLMDAQGNMLLNGKDIRTLNQPNQE